MLDAPDSGLTTSSYSFYSISMTAWIHNYVWESNISVISNNEAKHFSQHIYILNNQLRHTALIVR